MTMKVSMYFENLQLPEAAALLDLAKALRTEGPLPSAPPAPPTAEEPKKEQTLAGPTTPAPTPAVQAEIDKLLGEGFNWTQITGTGKGGKVTQTDVRKFHKAAVPAAKAAAAPAPVDPGPAESGDNSVTVDDARAALKRVSDDKTMDVAIKLLQDFGVSKISDIPADKLGDFVAQAAAL